MDMRRIQQLIEEIKNGGKVLIFENEMSLADIEKRLSQPRFKKEEKK